MATGRLQFPGHPRSHSYEYSSNAAFISNEALPILYEGYVFTPSEPRDDDLSSQDRWTRARITRSPATDENLQAEFDLQRHSKRTAQQDFCSISTTKRDQIMRLIEGMEKSNPGFTYQLVALKLEPDHAHEKNSTRKHDHKHRDSKKRRKATSLIQVVLQRKPGQRPNVISSAASTSSVQGVAGSTGSINRAGRPRGKLVPRTLSGSHINTSMPQYLPPYLRHDQKWSNETSSRRATPAAQTQASQNEPPRPVPVSYRSASNTSQDFCPTLSSSSSSLDAAESSPPRKFSTTSCIVSNLPNQRSGRSNGQPLGTDLTPMSPWPTVSTPKGHLYTQVTPNQATYQQSISAQPQSEYPFPSVPQRLYVSCSTQTDVSWFSRSQDSRRASGYNFSDHEAPPRAHRYDEDDHAGKSEPKDVQSSESGITTAEDSDDGCDQSKLSQSKGPPISKADEKPSWMNNLVPGRSCFVLR